MGITVNPVYIHRQQQVCFQFFFQNKSIGEIKDIILELDKFCMKKTQKLPKNLSYFSKIINSQNLARKDCLLLPFNTIKKIISVL